MTKKTTKTTKKPLKKPIDTEVSVDTAQESPVSKPSFLDYIKAVVGMGTSAIKTHRLRSAAVGVILIALVAAGVWWLLPSTAPITNDGIVVQVGKELSIQGDGNPVVLTVEDKNKATQPFLQQAENGDKVLLYYKAKKAVLYRPSQKRIVHQGVYTAPDAKVFIRKGTSNDGSVGALKKQLESIDGMTVASEDASEKSDYKGITLVHVTDRYDDKIRELADVLNAQIVRMPPGESFPDADILIIVGN